LLSKVSIAHAGSGDRQEEAMAQPGGITFTISGRAAAVGAVTLAIAFLGVLWTALSVAMHGVSDEIQDLRGIVLVKSEDLRNTDDEMVVLLGSIASELSAIRTEMTDVQASVQGLTDSLTTLNGRVESIETVVGAIPNKQDWSDPSFYNRLLTRPE
jgi:hypothetical protein